MTKRQGIRAIVFLALLGSILLWINDAIGTPRNSDVILMTRRFDELYSDPKNTWDGILLGTSVVDRAWAAPLAWEEYGMAVYPMSTDGQPIMMTTSVIEEVLKYHDLSFVVVELHGMRPGILKTNGSRIRWIADHMKMSLNRIRTVQKAFEHMDKWYPDRFDSSFVTRLSYYFPIVQFHKRLTTDKFYEGDFVTGETKMKGVYEAARHMRIQSEPYGPNDDMVELNEEQTEILDEIMAYCEEKELELIFLNIPSALPAESLAHLNASAEYVKEKGYPVLNFNEAELQELLNLNADEDFIDAKHLNTLGAHKFTECFSSWLHENLELTDHRGDERYESWEDAVPVYEAFYEEACETGRQKMEKKLDK